jgi:GrpB-like predicted nucleotidyltransferase (UPF0157 family)
VITTDHLSVERARAIAAEARDLLAEHGVPGELVLTGGSSLPGLVTKGDIDLHLRVRSAEFAAAVERLQTVARIAHPEIWTPSFATFERVEPPVVGIAVTVRGSEHDVRFTTAWERLAGDGAAREEYNALKQAEDYEAAKSSFFDRISSTGDSIQPRDDRLRM